MWRTPRPDRPHQTTVLEILMIQPEAQTAVGLRCVSFPSSSEQNTLQGPLYAIIIGNMLRYVYRSMARFPRFYQRRRKKSFLSRRSRLQHPPFFIRQRLSPASHSKRTLYVVVTTVGLRGTYIYEMPIWGRTLLNVDGRNAYEISHLRRGRENYKITATLSLCTSTLILGSPKFLLEWQL